VIHAKSRISAAAAVLSWRQPSAAATHQESKREPRLAWSIERVAIALEANVAERGLALTELPILHVRGVRQ
jgi:hypothetical protein